MDENMYPITIKSVTDLLDTHVWDKGSSNARGDSNGNQNNKNNNNNNNNGNNNNNNNNNNAPASGNATSFNQNSSMKCHVCGQVGHGSWQCKSPLKKDKSKWALHKVWNNYVTSSGQDSSNDTNDSSGTTTATASNNNQVATGSNTTAQPAVRWAAFDGCQMAMPAATSNQQQASGFPKELLQQLYNEISIDSGSGMISMTNPNYVNNIHKTENKENMLTNAGSKIMDTKCDVPDFEVG